MPLRPAIRAIDEFLKLESASSILLLSAALLALLANNTFLAPYYRDFLEIPISVYIDEWTINKPLLLWINDGLMAIFFLIVGLELKREVLEGHLSNVSQVALPIVAAVGGMLVPAMIYAGLNWQDAAALRGWAIPSATDIAFSLGILALLGSRVPSSLKIFLMALAIIDDLGAIIIIALFYSGHHMDLTYLFYAGIVLVILFLLNISHIKSIIAYLIAGLFLWAFVLKSGIHATIAGVTLAIFIPLRIAPDSRAAYDTTEGNETSPLRQLEHALHPWVAFFIMPLFAFANAGVSFEGLSLHSLLAPIPLGIVLGLFLGKLIGVFGFSFGMVKLGLARLPERANWLGLFGVAVLCGVGFTMSLFIGSLAFTTPDHMNQVRIGVLLGSLISAVVGYVVLLLATPKH